MQSTADTPIPVDEQEDSVTIFFVLCGTYAEKRGLPYLQGWFRSTFEPLVIQILAQLVGSVTLSLPWPLLSHLCFFSVSGNHSQLIGKKREREPGAQQLTGEQGMGHFLTSTISSTTKL